MGVSFSCGLLSDFLRNADEQVHEYIRGLILVSPVITRKAGWTDEDSAY